MIKKVFKNAKKDRFIGIYTKRKQYIKELVYQDELFKVKHLKIKIC